MHQGSCNITKKKPQLNNRKNIFAVDQKYFGSPVKMATQKRSYPFYYGGLASCIATAIVHPFDLAKVRLQSAKGANKASMLNTLSSIARNEGFLGLYNGISASLLRQATYSTVRFGAYDKLKYQFTSKNEKLTIWKMLLCSSAAGAMGGACGNPGDIINVRMQNDGSLAPNMRRNYKHALDGIVRMTREEGLGSLFRGIGPNMNRAILMTSSQCVSYDVFKDLVLQYTPMKDGLSTHFLSSLLTALVATTICSPVDVVKTRVMGALSSESGISAIGITTQMLKVEGISSFFRGWTPAFVRLGPQTIITFVVMEQFKKWSDMVQDQKLAGAVQL
ncbi:mitochondrial carrier domain-containing protein [Phycomyces nitens]|nr:mitochondrial carrier domain-containing protein [Phycomyces nitens]